MKRCSKFTLAAIYDLLLKLSYKLLRKNILENASWKLNINSFIAIIIEEFEDLFINVADRSYKVNIILKKTC